MSLDAAIEIAKKINPKIGPSLDLDRKTLTESQMKNKLTKFFALHKKAAEIILAHPGQNYDQIKKTFDINVKAHVSNDFHIVLFVQKVLGKKGDLNSLALSASRRIVLSEPRIEEYIKANPKIDTSKANQEITDDIQKLLINYFSNLKGQKLDQAAIVTELTGKVTARVGEILRAWSK